jgi:hypothetical protein
MEQRKKTNDVALKDAQIITNEEGYVGSTELTAATPLMNLLLFHHILDQSLRRLLSHLSTSVIWPLKRIQQLLQIIMRRSKVW